MHIVIPNDWNDAFKNSPLVDELQRLGTVTITTLPGPEQDRALEAAEAAVGIRERTRFDAALPARMPKLKLIAQIGGRDNPNIDMAAATARGVLVCRTTTPENRTARSAPGGMVELTIAMMIAALHHFAEHDRVIHAGGWPEPAGRTLAGKRLGIVGLGRIGGGVAKAARFFGMEVLSAGRTLTPERAEQAGTGFTDLETLFSTCDIISVHLKLNAATRGMITRELLTRMKPDAIFVNTSRGPVVDEAALVEALQARRIGGAALDVYDEEPMPADHPLRKCDNALLLGHLGWATQEAYAYMIPSIVQVITAFIDGSPINVVNPEARPSA